MKRTIKKLVNKYYKDVEKDIIGCGLNYSSETRLKTEITEMMTLVFDAVVGNIPDKNLNPDKYEIWYKKALVFGEIVKEMEKKYGDYISYFTTPTNLQSHYGPRD